MAMEKVTEFVKSEPNIPSIITNTTNESVYYHRDTIKDAVNTTVSEHQNLHNASINLDLAAFNEPNVTLHLLEAFILTEIVMTAIELFISVLAACMIPRWKNNYRNQMLMQLSLARLIKRIVYYNEYTEKKSIGIAPTSPDVVLFGAQTYIDFVIVIVVVYFIKHMYDSLIVVIVNINQGTLFKMLLCTWLLPLPISAAWAGIVSAKLIDEWLAYLLICSIFRWPLILVGTIFYITILYRVFTDKIRKFARILTFTTFFICIIVNFYLFSKDVIELWCFKSYVTVLINYVLGFLLNMLVLCFYLILIILNFKKKIKSTTSVPDYSIDNEVK